MDLIDNITILKETGFMFTIERRVLNMDITIVSFKMQN